MCIRDSATAERNRVARAEFETRQTAARATADDIDDDNTRTVLRQLVDARPGPKAASVRPLRSFNAKPPATGIYKPPPQARADKDQKDRFWAFGGGERSAAEDLTVAFNKLHDLCKDASLVKESGESQGRSVARVLDYMRKSIVRKNDRRLLALLDTLLLGTPSTYARTLTRVYTWMTNIPAVVNEKLERDQTSQFVYERCNQTVLRQSSTRLRFRLRILDAETAVPLEMLVEATEFHGLAAAAGYGEAVRHFEDARNAMDRFRDCLLAAERTQSLAARTGVAAQALLAFSKTAKAVYDRAAAYFDKDAVVSAQALEARIASIEPQLEDLKQMLALAVPWDWAESLSMTAIGRLAEQEVELELML